MSFSDINNIRQSKLFRDISNKDFETICGTIFFVIKDYNKKEIITGQGDDVNRIGIVQEGRVAAVKCHYDGSSQILRFIGSCGVIGLESVSSSFSTSPCMLIAEEYSSVILFKYEELFSCVHITAQCKQLLLQNIINILADENIRMMYKIDMLSKRTLRERIITHLSIIMEKRGGNTIDLQMTQEQFAQYLCVNRSVLSKELNIMRRENIIDFKGSVYTIRNIREKHIGVD